MIERYSRPTLEQVIACFVELYEEEHAGDEEAARAHAERFFKSYEERSWCAKDGQPVAFWDKLAAFAVRDAKDKKKKGHKVPMTTIDVVDCCWRNAEECTCVLLTIKNGEQYEWPQDALKAFDNLTPEENAAFEVLTRTRKTHTVKIPKHHDANWVKSAVTQAREGYFRRFGDEYDDRMRLWMEFCGGYGELKAPDADSEVWGKMLLAYEGFLREGRFVTAEKTDKN